MSAESELLVWLHQTAGAGQPCPSNKAIAERFGFSGTTSAARLMAKLEDQGAIRIVTKHRGRDVTLLKAALPPGKPRISAAVIRAAKIDGRDLPVFVSALIEMGLECWRDDRVLAGKAVLP